ncbi:MAG: alpha/beta hydrolase [Proteobacteria bacterium]|nr:alpha/beta hydrolase [Pseudomonadota bacterium]MDA1059113.1 alpha/beta hydrolase [Pseudomonadota bacterium]
MMEPVRGFIDIDEGQVHYRTAGHGGTPLVMFHGSPGSSKMLSRLMSALGETRHVIALDTMGQGDSSAPARDNVDMAYFADAACRGLDAYGGMDQVDVFGTHTGARIATEFAIHHPQRTRKLVLDGMSAAVTPQGLDYAKTLDKRHLVDQVGTQFFNTWTSLRDGYLFWPATARDAAHRRPTGLPPLDRLHDHVVDILKGFRTSHHAYIAAVTYPSPDRLPLITVPTLAVCARNDVPYAHLDGVADLVPGCAKMAHPHDNPETLATTEETQALAKMLADWLDG